MRDADKEGGAKTERTACGNSGPHGIDSALIPLG
jgi:hypothetical protein